MKLKVTYTTCHSTIVEIPLDKPCDDMGPKKKKKLLETLWQIIPESFSVLGWEEVE